MGHNYGPAGDCSVEEICLMIISHLNEVYEVWACRNFAKLAWSSGSFLQIRPKPAAHLSAVYEELHPAVISLLLIRQQ